MIFIFKVREQCSKCEGYGHCNTSAPQRVDMLILCLVMMLMTRGLLKMSTFLQDYCVVEDTLVDFNTPILDEFHISSESTTDLWMR